MRSRIHTATALAAAAALLLTACSPDTPGSTEPEPGPLDELFQDIYGTADETQADAMQMRMEELVAECMAEQGFEYIPVDWSQSGVSYSSDDLDVEWGSREFAEKYGYGASTDPWGTEEAEMPLDEFVDPNEDYVMAMSETEREAYYSALYGDQTGPEEGAEDEWEYRWEEAGCQGRAQHETYEVAPGLDEDRFAALQAEMQAMWESTMTDPRLAELNAAWASCMSDAGHPGFAAAEDAQNSIYDEMNRIWENAYEGIAPDAGEDEWKAVEEGIQDRMAEISEREIALAVTDFECREKVDYDTTQRDIAREYEQEFYDAHKDELEAWRDAAVAARG